MVGRLLRYFLSNLTEMYTIRLTIQVRKSCFIQNRTLRGGWNILIGIFFRFRTLPAGILDADQDFIGDSAHFPYSIHAGPNAIRRPAAPRRTNATAAENGPGMNRWVARLFCQSRPGML